MLNSLFNGQGRGRGGIRWMRGALASAPRPAPPELSSRLSQPSLPGRRKGRAPGWLESVRVVGTASGRET